MYPNLLAPLLIALAIALSALVLVAVRQPVSRRLAFRQLARRRTEAALVISGSVLGTAIIVGALVVGDTLNFSVRQEAYRTLGPVDERVIAPAGPAGRGIAQRLGALSGNPDIDGVLSAQATQAAAVSHPGGQPIAEPRALAWQMDFAEASRFGRAGGDPGLGGANPKPGHVVVNEPLARSLRVGVGQRVTFYLFGTPQTFRVDRVVPEQGLAGVGLGGRLNRDAFLPPGTLDSAARAAGAEPRSVTFVSNRGGVEGGDALTEEVTADIQRTLGLVAEQAAVETPKHTVLREAKVTGDTLGALFLMIGSFSIIAGALLLVNIFVMLGEERKSQLGMLRAVGMKRSRLVGSFTLEGAAYALLSALPGVAIGVAVGWGVAVVAAEIFQGWSVGGSSLQIVFAVTPTSILNGAAMGLLIAFVAILVTTVRISRFNIIAAIRDLPPGTGRKPRRRLLVISSTLALLCALAAVPALARSQAEQTYLMPALAIAFATPAMLRVMPGRTAITLAAGAVLAWTLVAPVVRPRIFDTPSMAVYVIQGSLAAFSAVVLVSENQKALVRPLRPLLERPSESGLAARLAVAYPLAKRFRTGATLVMYTLIVLVLVLLTEISGILNASVNTVVSDATAGYSLRLDFNAQVARDRLLTDLRSGPSAGQISAVTPLLNATGQATDPGHRTSSPLDTAVVGVPDGAITGIAFGDRMPGLRDDAAVWRALAARPQYVVIDAFFGSTGGPSGDYYDAGDKLALTDPRTGRTEQKTIAGVLKNGMVFYPGTGASSTVYPVVIGETGMRDLFGTEAQNASVLVRTRPGVSPDTLATQLQGEQLSSSLVATPIASDVRRQFDSSTTFFRLMQGFLALGLLVGVTGLGVVMVRAVRERRRTIGILRALGFRARTVQRSFLWESAFIAVEGIVLGSLLGVLTTWLMYRNSSAFAGLEGGFPIEWASISVLAAATFAASLLATIGPARRAAAIRPALAVRIAE
ncbi:ABC-type lipoprotein release transport system permease subunit [Streptomyces sp. SLBN-118]|uniref:ABC transporter permease n=1 Tax=Streptomyces sp. SLBN-118 TaxID=2768454 RepID=UPI0011509BFE|nr:FtsX-like permease family protein [Streptomyces sp. SLBN-118]TQK49987.1 ABC-type lipoprotein release transport system permease subunit [Streptomyces sp. SLBN-118]